MMLVNALTMESPVITVYKMAPNAAAAMVPIAYSTVDIPSSSTTNNVRRAHSARIVFRTIMVPLISHRPSQNSRPQHVAGQPGDHGDDAQTHERRQIAEAQRPCDQHGGPLRGGARCIGGLVAGPIGPLPTTHRPGPT